MNKGKKLIWGFIFIAAAVLMLFNKFDIFDNFHPWKIVVALLLVLWVLDGIKQKEWGSILFPIAFLCIVFDDLPGMGKITPMPVIWAAILGSIGMKLITDNKNKDFNNSTDYIEYKETGMDGKNDGEVVRAGGPTDNTFMFMNNFSSSVKYISSDDFLKAKVINKFGDTKIYFDDAIIRCEEAVVELNVRFGSVELYVPKEWYVTNAADAVFGGITEKNRSVTTGSPKLKLVGDVSFGNVTVIYC